jgi:hypothetical protein
MRSRADRERVEWLLRAGALALLVVALVRLILAGTASGTPSVHVRAEGGLEAGARDSLAALARSGARVTWSGAVAALAVASEPVRDPSARTRIAVAGEAAATLGDSLGALDSLAAGGGALTTSGLAGPVRVLMVAGTEAGGAAGRAARTAASTRPPLGARVGRVLVLGRLGWETKFTIAALEEAGWLVDARLRLADTLRITQGGSAPLSLATHAAVIVLDTAVGAQAGAIARFVRSGGGLVLAGDAAGAPAFAALAPARAGATEEGERDAFDRDEPKHALPFRPLVSLRADAVPLERRDDAVAIAARRLAAGRVVQVGYDETWRWRMQAERDGPAAHRAFWNQLVATAAAAVPSSTADTARAGSAPIVRTFDEAPLAALVQRLGPAVADAPATRPVPSSLPAWSGAVALLLLLAEWASRRARGAA